MLVNEVVSVVGLSRKSIRYYEEVGLLRPSRNSSNDYRIYNDSDIKELKLIKFLRELDVSINDIKLLQSGELSLEDCMNNSILKIDKYVDNYSKIKDVCSEISSNNESYNSIDIDKYHKPINILKKEGFTMKKVKSDNKKKIEGAIISSSLFSIFYLFILGVITYFQFTEADKMPWILYIILMLVLLLPIVGVIYNLVARIKEIKGGEEDEASKY